MADDKKRIQGIELTFKDEGKIRNTNENANSTVRVNTGITAESLYLGLAMWMEMFPEESPTAEDSGQLKSADHSHADFYRKIGCVLVQQDTRLVAIDRSRDGVHGLARMLVKNHGRVAGGSVYISRKPCSYCTKLLVRAGIAKVFFPPVEPEFNNSKEEKRVAILLDAGQVTQSVLIPQVKMDPKLATVTEEGLGSKGILLNDFQEYTQNVFRRFWSEECVRRMSGDSIEQAHSKLENLVKWMAQIYLPLAHSKFRCFTCHKETKLKSEEKIVKTFDPENEMYHEQIAKHLLGLAAMTIQRTVEPQTGVGCVVMKDNNLVAVGWNDFPSRVIEEDFHRASDQERDKKYPFFVHAEQNALLMRNLTDITGGVIFVTKTPCHECTPLVKVSGIETVVLSTSLEPIKEKYRLNYEVFRKEVEKGSFLCYEMSTV